MRSEGSPVGSVRTSGFGPVYKTLPILALPAAGLMGLGRTSGLVPVCKTFQASPAAGHGLDMTPGLARVQNILSGDLLSFRGVWSCDAVTGLLARGLWDPETGLGVFSSQE